MAMLGFGKKKGQEIPKAPQAIAAAPNTPYEEVLKLRQQGLSNNQIAESLSKAGYKTHQIFDALSQAEIGRPADAIEGAPYFEQAPQQPQQQQQYQEPSYQEQPAQQQDYSYEEKIEEIAEAIIEEKWQELLKDINKIVEWKSAMEANMKMLEQRQEDLRRSFDSMQKGVLSKVNDYDQNITNVGSELKALEKVFQKILPTFTENVNELSRTVKELKKK